MKSDKKWMLLLSMHEQMGCRNRGVALTIKSIGVLFLWNLLAVMYGRFVRDILLNYKCTPQGSFSK